MAAPADAECVGAVGGGDSPCCTRPEVLALIFLPAPVFQLEPPSTELLAQEERFSEILKEYELKCRVSDPLPELMSGAVCSGLVAPCTSWPARRGGPSPGPQGHPYMSRAGTASDTGCFLQLRSSEPRPLGRPLARNLHLPPLSPPLKMMERARSLSTPLCPPLPRPQQWGLCRSC